MRSLAFSPIIFKLRNLDEFIEIVSVTPKNALLVREIVPRGPLSYACFEPAFHSEAS